MKTAIRLEQNRLICAGVMLGVIALIGLAAICEDWIDRNRVSLVVVCFGLAAIVAML